MRDKFFTKPRYKNLPKQQYKVPTGLLIPFVMFSCAAFTVLAIMTSIQ